MNQICLLKVLAGIPTYQQSAVQKVMVRVKHDVTGMESNCTGHEWSESKGPNPVILLV